jgi:hypothetical protein
MLFSILTPFYFLKADSLVDARAVVAGGGLSSRDVHRRLQKVSVVKRCPMIRDPTRDHRPFPTHVR